MTAALVAYDREVLVEVITYHRKVEIKGCMCGWAELGKNHSEHVANIYETSMQARHVQVDLSHRPEGRARWSCIDGTCARPEAHITQAAGDPS